MTLRVAEGRDGEEVVLSTWCPGCREWVMPTADNVTCVWCGGETTREPKGADVAVATMARCMFEGCDGEAQDRAGRYARLCGEHKTAAREASGAKTPAARSSPRTAGVGMAGKVRAVVPVARKVDALKGKLAALPSGDEARTLFKEAARVAESRPTPTNLAALQAAMRALKRDGSVKRERLEADLAYAERELATALRGLLDA